MTMSAEFEDGWWGSLPDVCLRHVFRHLCDCDRRSAALVCHHWHNAMCSPCLWHHRFFYFSGRLSLLRQEQYESALSYAHYLGVYLQSLEICVHPPRKFMEAHHLNRAISGLFAELTRVRAPLRSISLVELELDRHAWRFEPRNGLINNLIHFLHRVTSKLTSVCLTRMRNNMHQDQDGSLGGWVQWTRGGVKPAGHVRWIYVLASKDAALESPSSGGSQLTLTLEKCVLHRNHNREDTDHPLTQALLDKLPSALWATGPTDVGLISVEQ